MSILGDSGQTVAMGGEYSGANHINSDTSHCCIFYLQVRYDHFTSASVYSCIICYLNISCLQSVSHQPCFFYQYLSADLSAQNTHRARWCKKRAAQA